MTSRRSPAALTAAPASTVRWAAPQATVLQLLERRPGEGEVLGADVAEADRRLRLLAIADDVDDHAFAEGGVLDVVADTQPDLLRVRRLWGEATTSRERGIDHPFAMGVGGL